MQNAASVIDEHELSERAFRFACDIAKLCEKLAERGPIVRRLSFQLFDAGTSIGANLTEGQAGQSKPDFITKNFISLKESRETRFWLRVLSTTHPEFATEARPFLQEANEFVAMLTSLLKTAKSSPSRG